MVDIPEGWSLPHAEELCERISVGIVVKPKDYYVPEGEGTRAFRSANVREGYVEDKNWVYISDEGNQKNKKSILQADDILVVRTGYPGTACIVPPKYAGSNCIDVIFARPDQAKVTSKYLCAFTNSEHGRRQVLDGQGGLAQQHFNVGSYKNLLLPLPPLPEQKKIAEILSTWDRAIEVVERLIENSQAQKKALMQQLLTGKKRLPGFDGEWETKTLSQIALIIMGSSPKSTAYNDKKFGLPLLQGNADIKNRVSAPRTYTSQITKECLEKDILLSVRAPVGEVSRSIHNACIGRGISAIRAKENAVQKYLYQWLLYFEPKWAKLSQGSTFEAVNSNDIKSLKISVPSKGEQDKIAAVLSCADWEIEILQSQLQKLKSEKSALMQQLLTGKRRVKIDEEVANA